MSPDSLGNSFVEADIPCRDEDQGPVLAQITTQDRAGPTAVGKR